MKSELLHICIVFLYYALSVHCGELVNPNDTEITFASVKTLSLKRKNIQTDIIFVLDGSASIKGDRFKHAKNWMRRITREFHIEDGFFRVEVIQYSHWFYYKKIEEQPYIETEISLGEIQNIQDFEDKMDIMRPHGYTTYTGHALEKVFLDFKDLGRTEARKIMILLTDGRSDDPRSVIKNAEKLRNMGVAIFAIGFGDVNKYELREIATGDVKNKNRVYIIPTFSRLREIVDDLLKEIDNLH